MLILATWSQTSHSCFPLFNVDHLKIANCSNLIIVFYPLGSFGQALCIRSCHENLILIRKNHNWAGIAFIQGDSVGGSKFSEHTSHIFTEYERKVAQGAPHLSFENRWRNIDMLYIILKGILWKFRFSLNFWKIFWFRDFMSSFCKMTPQWLQNDCPKKLQTFKIWTYYI